MARKSTRRGAGRLTGPMGLVGVMFLASAIVRLAIGATSVWAANPDPAAEEKQSSLTEVSQMATDSAAAAELCYADADLQRLLDSLLVREAAVLTQETALAERERLVAAREAEASERLATAEAAERSLEKTMAVSDVAAENDLIQLTKVYEAMKPKKAAALFEAMTPDFAAGFLGRMTPEPAGAILAELTPEFAFAVTAVLAGRNANAGR